MKIKGTWKVTSFEIEKNSENQNLIELLKKEKIGDDDSEKYIIYNQQNLWLFESDFIIQEDSFANILDKFSSKDYLHKIKYFHDGIFEDLAASINEVEIYSKIIEGNNISGINRSKLKISVNILRKTLLTGKDKFVESLYILIFLANKTEKNGNKFMFAFEDGEQSFRENIAFEGTKEYDLFVLYDWVTNDNDYPDSFKTKIAIVRKIIFNRKSFENSDEILIEAKSAFNRIISRETDKYFEQVNQLKEDFLLLAESQNKVNRSLHLSVFGWLGYLAWTIFDVVRSYSGNNLFNKILFSQSEKISIVLLILFLALVVIFSAHIKEIYDNRKTYMNLKDMYQKKLFFNEEDFVQYMNKPTVSKIYVVGFIVLIFILFFRFLGFSRIILFFKALSSYILKYHQITSRVCEFGYWLKSYLGS